ncbi:glycosyltransferase family 39 protein [Shewanella yunxiaonensis]|uniref:Glycosyltransferase family 39 protein n=1 Tax=Shewanella yunxiaonensis TaxID=2829809 RepID=A0ABX7YRW0_9GAMM|nr:glycosyltransferase family 39 protein [Shewanella yunxiaonensis]QUN05377.1 glycosyltransferase family 39 protein [Shewanella yunxiaonensis]
MNNRLTPAPTSVGHISSTAFLWCTLLAALGLIAAHLWLRPLMPVDETRYVSVAWEMWRDHNWLVPHQNGETYAHKPPLLFWLINLAWALFGVSEWPARLSVPLAACINFWLLHLLAKKYYPSSETAARFAPVILLALGGWCFYLPTIMFDLLLSIFVLLWILSCLEFSESGSKKALALAGFAIGMGLLAKGPVMLLYAVPFMLLRRWWQAENSIESKRFAKGCGLAILIGLLLLACWVIPAVIAGGGAYENELIWKQTTGRMVSAFAHARPIYWYLYLLPILLLPLPLLGGVWKSSLFKVTVAKDKALLIYIALIIGCFSLISGKQIHYLCPLMPIIALYVAGKVQPNKFGRSYLLAAASALIAAAIISLPYWASHIFKNIQQPHVYTWVAIAPLLMVAVSLVKFRQEQLTLYVRFLVFPVLITSLLMTVKLPLHQSYDITQAAKEVKILQDQGNTLVFWDKYDNQFQFAGKLYQPIIDLQGDYPERLSWLEAHPQTIVICPINHPSDALLKGAIYSQTYRGRYLLIVKATDFISFMRTQG